MSKHDLASIPLPSLAVLGKMPRKTAKEMLQEALRGTQRDKKELRLRNASSSDKSISSGQSKMKESCNGVGKSSQSIVDELFKDFIAQKFNRVPSDDEFPETEGMPGFMVGSSVDEMSKLLDMEINSIQNSSGAKEAEEKHLSQVRYVDVKAKSTKHPHRMKSGKRSRTDEIGRQFSTEREAKRHNHLSLKSVTEIKELDIKLEKVGALLSSKEIKETQWKEKTDDRDMLKLVSEKSVLSSDSCIVLPAVVPELSNSAESLPASITLGIKPEPAITTQPEVKCDKDSSIKEPTKETQDNSDDKGRNSSGLMLPIPLAKKQAIPKQLGLKLTSVSLSLIKSSDRIDQDGRVWEEGEVNSSNSDNEEVDSESEPDGYPSETGSINSDAEDWCNHVHKGKKKHKHKHKKKKKKSSNKDKEKRSKDHQSDEKISYQDRKRTKEKRSPSDRKSKERSRSKSREDSKRRKRDDDADEIKKIEALNQRQSSRSRSKSPKHQRSCHKSRSRSRSPQRGRYDEWDARHYFSKHHTQSQTRQGSSERRSSSSGRYEERRKKESREQRLQIDKAKLRRIAIANALVNMRAGQGPQVEVPVVKNEGKSVQELTEFCKKISDKGKGEDSEVSDSSDEEAPNASDEEETLIHHPFKIKEPITTGIVMNIRNSKQLPVLTPLEKQAQKANLRLAFPVSSGSHHRANESEWVPVERPNPSAAARPTTSGSSVLSVSQKAKPSSIAESAAHVAVPEESKKTDSIFPDPSEAQDIDIGTIISERLQAVRKLQQNPFDVQALSTMHKAQEQASKWATSKHLPGQFTGTTGAKVLSQAELIGDKKHQAWAKKVTCPGKPSRLGYLWSL